MRRAERLRGDHEFAPRQSERCRPCDAHEGGNAEHAENAGEIEDRLPEISGYGQRQDQRWKGEQHVHAADHQRLEAAAKITRQHPKRATDRDPDHRRAKADDQRYPRAIDQPGQFVPPEAIGAEPVQRRHRRPAFQHVHVGRTGHRQQRCERGSGKDEHHPADRRPEQRPEPARPPCWRDGDLLVEAEFKRGHGGSWDRARRRADRQ